MMKYFILLTFVCFLVTPVTSKGDEAYKDAINNFLQLSAKSFSGDGGMTIKLSERHLCELKFEAITGPPDDSKNSEKTEEANPASDSDTNPDAETVASDSKLENADAETVNPDAEAVSPKEDVANPDAETVKTKTVEDPPDETTTTEEMKAELKQESEKSLELQKKLEECEKESSELEKIATRYKKSQDETTTTEEMKAELKQESEKSLELQNKLEECEKESSELEKIATRYDILLPKFKSMIKYIAKLVAETREATELKSSEKEAKEDCEERMAKINDIMGRLDSKLSDANSEIDRLKNNKKSGRVKKPVNSKKESKRQQNSKKQKNSKKKDKSTKLDKSRKKENVKKQERSENPKSFKKREDNKKSQAKPLEEYNPYYDNTDEYPSSDEYEYLEEDYDNNRSKDRYLVMPQLLLRGRILNFDNDLNDQMIQSSYLRNRLSPTTELTSRLTEADTAITTKTGDPRDCKSYTPGNIIKFKITKIGSMEMTEFDMYDLNAKKVTYTIRFLLKPTLASSSDPEGELPVDIFLAGEVAIKVNTVQRKSESVKVIHLKLELDSINFKHEDQIKMSFSNSESIKDEVRRQINVDWCRVELRSKMDLLIKTEDISNPMKHT